MFGRKRTASDELRGTLDMLEALASGNTGQITEQYAAETPVPDTGPGMDPEVRKHNYVHSDSEDESLGAVYADDMNKGFVSVKDEVAFAEAPETLIGTVVDIDNRLDTEFKDDSGHHNQQMWMIDVEVPKESIGDVERIRPGFLQQFDNAGFVSVWPKDIVKYEKQELPDEAPEEEPQQEESIDNGIWEAAERKVLGLSESKASNNKKKVDAEELPEKPEILKVKKKPVVVQALLFNGDNSDQIREYTGKGKWVEKKNGKYFINTLEGEMEASIGDYIIQGVDKDFYAIKPDIFKKTYVRQDGKPVMESTEIMEVVVREETDLITKEEFMDFLSCLNS